MFSFCSHEEDRKSSSEGQIGAWSAGNREWLNRLRIGYRRLDFAACRHRQRLFHHYVSGRIGCRRIRRDFPCDGGLFSPLPGLGLRQDDQIHTLGLLEQLRDDLRRYGRVKDELHFRVDKVLRALVNMAN